MSMNSNLSDLQNLLEKRNITNIPNIRDLQFNPIKTVWITLNRSCNFRCPHCYAMDTGFKKSYEMPLPQVKELVDFSKEIGAKIIILIGGEPLLYKEIFEVLDYIKQKGLISAISSNGYLLEDDAFFEKISSSPLGSFVFSIKAGDAELYKKLTQTDAFEKIKKAVSNFAKLTSEWNSYMLVLTKDTLKNLHAVANLVKEDKSKALRINFCSPIIEASGRVNGDSMLEIREMAAYLVKHYEELDAILQGRLLIQLSVPRCFFPKDFIQKLEQKNQVTFSCHLYRRTGLVFDTKRRLLLCNSLPNFTIAQFGKDFSTAEEFKDFFMQKDICDLYKSIFKYTSKSCSECSDYLKCLSGCPLMWFYYSGNIIAEEHKKNSCSLATKGEEKGNEF